MRKIFLTLLLMFLFCGLALAQEETQDGYTIALERIEEARTSGASLLPLSDLGLESLPESLWELESLETLELSGNALRELPPQIGQLSQLRELYLYGNRLERLPSEIGLLTNLCYLQVNENQLRTLPFELGNLERLASGENCDSLAGHGLYAQVNPLISPPPEVVEQGTYVILAYLRNEAWWHFQRLLVGGLSFAGVLAGTILALCWKNQRGKAKRKHEG